MRHVVSAMLIAVAIIHLLPVTGVLGRERLGALYGVSLDDPNLAILMRHRAVLFGLLGACLLYAAFRPAFQPAAFGAGFVSVVSFLVIAWREGRWNAPVRRVVVADLVALGCLVAGAAAYAAEGLPA